jgi:hypothetical protein
MRSKVKGFDGTYPLSLIHLLMFHVNMSYQGYWIKRLTCIKFIKKKMSQTSSPSLSLKKKKKDLKTTRTMAYQEARTLFNGLVFFLPSKTSCVVGTYNDAQLSAYVLFGSSVENGITVVNAIDALFRSHLPSSFHAIPRHLTSFISQSFSRDGHVRRIRSHTTLAALHPNEWCCSPSL